MSTEFEAIAVIIFMFVIISSIVGALVWIYIKNVQLKDETARKIEMVGYFLLFCLIVWQYVIKNLVMGNFYGSDYYLNEKLDAIFRALNSFWSGSKHTNQAYFDYRQLLERQNEVYLSTQLFCIDTIEAILQVISTACIAVGRFQELLVNSRKDVSKSEETRI